MTTTLQPGDRNASMAKHRLSPEKIHVSLLACIFAFTITACSRTSPYDDAVLALYDRDVEKLTLILDQTPGVISEVSGFDGATLLHKALVNTPSYECAQLLIDRGIDVNQPDVTGECPLHIICFGGDEQCVKLLLDRGADPTVKWGQGKRTLVDLAGSRGHVGVVQLLQDALEAK